MLYSRITEQIIGCAFIVYKEIGFGFLESVYEKSLQYELIQKGLKAETQFPIKVFYKNVVLGQFVADLLVNDTVIIELKSIRELSTDHEVQLVNYLVATRKPVGLLINFGPEKVEIKRKHFSTNFDDTLEPYPVNPV